MTVVDDGTMPDRRGSLTVDDEGTPTNYTVLIEDGILKGYMQDRMNARLLGAAPTGNGRRQSFAHAPMPRMTNTYMLAGAPRPAGNHRPRSSAGSMPSISAAGRSTSPPASSCFLPPKPI